MGIGILAQLLSHYGTQEEGSAVRRSAPSGAYH